MTEILDTIDNTLRDYEVSGDAMRWTPEEQALPQSRFPSIEAFATLGRSVAAIIEAQRAAYVQVGKALMRMCAAVERATDLRQQLAEAETSERRSVMHANYHRRSRARKRRNRR